MKYHHTSHAPPSPPVIQKAARHPKRSAKGVTSSGVISEPQAAPLYPMAVPRDCRLAGRQSVDIFMQAGNTAPSPIPNTVRAIAKPQKPYTQACAVLANVQRATAAATPTRNPTKSSTDPQIGFASM